MSISTSSGQDCDENLTAGVLAETVRDTELEQHIIAFGEDLTFIDGDVRWVDETGHDSTDVFVVFDGGCLARVSVETTLTVAWMAGRIQQLQELLPGEYDFNIIDRGRVDTGSYETCKVAAVEFGGDSDSPQGQVLKTFS